MRNNQNRQRKYRDRKRKKRQLILRDIFEFVCLVALLLSFWAGSWIAYAIHPEWFL